MGNKISPPKNFKFKVHNIKSQYHSYEFRIELWNTRKSLRVGYIELERNPYSRKILRDGKWVRPKAFTTHSNLLEEYRGRGLGTLLYAKAIEHCLKRGWKVSSTSPSEWAQNVWESRGLRKFFSIKKRSIGWGTERWYAYNKG